MVFEHPGHLLHLFKIGLQSPGYPVAGGSVGKTVSTTKLTDRKILSQLVLKMSAVSFQESRFAQRAR
jgi:hypothetical protein